MPLPEETRRVQTIRGSTHLISLPKPWVDQLGIHAGTPLTLRLLPDGGILLSLPAARMTQPLNIDLQLDADRADEVERAMIAAYLGGYDVIRVSPARGGMDTLEEAARRVCDRVRGLIISERTTSCLVFQDILDPSEFNAKKGIRRMHIEARTMLLDAVRQATGDPNAPQLDEVLTRENELDRINLILLKQHNTLIRNAAFTAKVGLRPDESLSYLFVAQYLERIGDYALRIGRAAGHLGAWRAGLAADHLKGAGDVAVKLTDDALAAFHRRDLKLANETIRAAASLQRLAHAIPVEAALRVRAAGRLPVCAECLGYSDAFESLERVGLYAKSIAEVAINDTLAPRETLAGGTR